jgi:endonuclease/exonuclease/phosphatase family metal-dependent hydrolase
VGGAALIVTLLGALVIADNLREDPQGTDATEQVDSTEASSSDRDTTRPASPQKVRPGIVILRKPKPPPEPEPEPVGPVIVEAGTGRVGSGLAVGPLEGVDAPIGPAVTGSITTAVANLPNRTSAGGFAASIRTVTAAAPDFVMLNEVSSRSIDGLRASAAGYDAYRDPQADRSAGGFQAMNNVVMWDTGRWTLVDAGRVKLVEDDGSIYKSRPVVWDRFAMWAMLQREDGAIVSMVSTHMMTNPAKYPQQPGNPRQSRVERYSAGMDVLLETVATLAAHGPVLVGGDMNSHPNQGAWTAAAKMTSVGYGYAKDRAVMYLFYPAGVQVLDHREVRVDSDHPAIVTTLDMNGQGAS